MLLFRNRRPAIELVNRETRITKLDKQINKPSGARRPLQERVAITVQIPNTCYTIIISVDDF